MFLTTPLRSASPQQPLQNSKARSLALATASETTRLVEHMMALYDAEQESALEAAHPLRQVLKRLFYG